ncbi:MAG: hypothetical protein HKO07_01955, partial [Pseudomonadales bacterium]|nr:hypothetical protein [Pseudomonadales bacterium]
MQQGEVSEPVLTDAGIHLIKVTDIEKDEMPPFSELKPVIETQLAQRAARKVYVQQMERARDIAFNAADLQEPADALGLAVQRADSIAREGLHAGVNQAATAEHQHDGMVETIFSDSRVLAALFSEEVLKDRMNSELIELNDTQGVLVRVASTHEPRQLALSEVRNTIEARLREVKAREKARALAVSLRDQVRDGANFATAVKAAKAAKLQPNIDVDVTRQGSELPAELIEAVFATPRSSVTSGVQSAATGEADASEDSEQGSAGSAAVGVVALANGDQVVYQVREIGEAQSDYTDEQLALFARQAGSALARQELN